MASATRDVQTERYQMITTSVPGNNIRERAAARFAQLGWPTTAIEEWRYTSLAPLQKIAWRTDDAPVGVDSPATLAGRATIELVFVNGRLAAAPDESNWPSGVTRSAATTPLADWERNAMVALNAANMQDGAAIEIAGGTVVDGFIHLLFVGRGDGIWSHPRNVITVGANAQVTIVETYVGSGNYFTNAVTEIVAGEGAVIDHYIVECQAPAAFHVANLYVRQERASTVSSRLIATGGALARNETHVLLSGEGASVTLEGLYAATGTQHIDNRTVIDHAEPHCESRELYKGVLDDNARGIFDGRIIVRPGAQKTSSKQENRNLLLSESAVADSKPTLEIHNDDVKCNHGSTIGQIEQEPLFYLRSRGLSEEEARNLLVYAFAGEIVDRIKVEPVREQVRRALFRSLPQRLPERRGGSR